MLLIYTADKIYRMQQEEIQQLVRRFLEKTASEEEINILSNWYRENAGGDVELFSGHEDKKMLLQETMLKNIVGKTGLPQLKKRTGNYIWMRIAAIAIVLLGIGSVLYYYNSNQKKENLWADKSSGSEPAKIIPGSNGAILTLANGKQVVLDSASVGKISNEAGTALIKTNDSSLVYQNNGNAAGPVDDNTLETPKGKQFSVTLPDGTKVWLNAASSIRYPVCFKGKERLVTVTGEAYFEVVHNSKQPFKVKAGNTVIEDIGTAFNINAYADEPSIKTTLVQGSVAVSSANNKALLSPGQQATIGINSAIGVEKVNIENAIAWRNGVIVFDDQDIQMILRQVARWYNVNVVYQGNISKKLFAGSVSMSRLSNLSEFLKILEFEDIHYKLQGRDLIIMQ